MVTIAIWLPLRVPVGLTFGLRIDDAGINGPALEDSKVSLKIISEPRAGFLLYKKQ